MVSLVGVALALMHVIETNLVRVGYHCITLEFHYTDVTRQSTLVIKVCVMYASIYICVSRLLKEELAWAMHKRLLVVSNIIYLFETVLVIYH